MEITFDPAKRERTLAERALDFAEAAEVFAGVTVTIPDLRKDYGEDRFISVGMLRGRMVVIGWTAREGTCRVFSMRKANEREQERYGQRLAEG